MCIIWRQVHSCNFLNMILPVCLERLAVISKYWKGLAVNITTRRRTLGMYSFMYADSV